MTSQTPKQPDRAAQQADSTTARVLAILAAYRAGQMSAPDMSRGASVAIYAGKLIASRLADVKVSTALNKPPVGVSPGPQHLDRLNEAVTTILDESGQDDENPGPEPRLGNLATAEVLESHAKSLAAAMREQGVSTWRELVAPDACEVCQPFADRVHDASETFEPHHPRCRCRPDLPEAVQKAVEAPTKPEPEPDDRLVRITFEVA